MSRVWIALAALLPAVASAQSAPATIPSSSSAPATGAPTISAPAPAPRFKLIVLDLKGTVLTPAELSMLSALVTTHLADYAAFEVTSGADVREMLVLEGQKQAIGCEQDTSCLAEVANAMGARLIVYGQIGKLGSQYLCNLSLYDSLAARAGGRAALTASNVDELVVNIPATVDKLVAEFLDQQGAEKKRKGAVYVAKTAVVPVVPPPSLPVPPAPVPTTPTAAPATATAGPSWLAWVSGIGTGCGLGSAGAVQGLLLALAISLGAPAEYLRPMLIPVIGPWLALARLEEERGSGNGSGDDGGPPDFLFPVFYGIGALGALGAIATAGGAVTWFVVYLIDSPSLTAFGHLWRWGLLLGGTALAGGGLAFDLLSPSSTDHQLDALDALPVALYIGGVTVVATGLFINPWVQE